MFYDEERWQKFRAEALEHEANRERTVLQEWLDDIRFAEPVGYYRDGLNNVMTLYSTMPGLLIGMQGRNIEKLKRMMFDEYHVVYEIKFVEIRGGFVNV